MVKPLHHTEMMEVMAETVQPMVIHTIQQAAEVVRDILVKELFRKYARAVVDRKQVTVIGRGQTMLVVETVVLVLI
jgi:hypothetical protein